MKINNATPAFQHTMLRPRAARVDTILSTAPARRLDDGETSSIVERATLSTNRAGAIS